MRQATAPSADGLLLVDKPAGLTSHDVVAGVRRALGERRIGHLGTLDPFATGLLVLLVGRATRLAPYVAGEPKRYLAGVRFGTETTTDDRTGDVTRSAPLPDVEAVRDAIARLTGELEQLPPAFSAKKVDGERSYAAARAGRALELRPVPVIVHEWTVHALSPEHAELEVVCSGGTYVRALARDLGRLAGSAAHLDALRRLSSGPFHVSDARSWADLTAGEAITLVSPLSGLADVVPVVLDEPRLAQAVHGNQIPAEGPGERAALLDARGDVVAVAERRGDRWQPRVVLRDA